MITLQQFLELVNFRINDGGEYFSDYLGQNLHCLTFWDENHDGVSASAVFSKKTHQVLRAEICDYKNNRAYVLINPEVKDRYNQEKKTDPKVREAWDKVNWTELETDSDWLKKAQRIISYQDYDTRVEIEVNLDDSEFLRLARLAHSRDITINEMVAAVLTEVIQNQNSLSTEASA